MDPQRRAGLLNVKLAALAGVEAPAEPADFGAGAALLHGGRAWVLLEPCDGSGLGAALAWALRRGASALTVAAASGTGVLARRAAGFAFPIDVRVVDGRRLVPAKVEPLPLAPSVDGGALAFVDTIRAAGAEPVVEHGVLAGEVLGLEVCRVVVDPFHDGEWRLEVGIGAHDREVFQMLHGDRPTVEALADVVESVAAHRRPGAGRHPFNLLAQERLLRARLVAEPELVGASMVAAAPPPSPRPNLKDAVPCVALAEIGGRSVTAVCSVGVDLELVPFAVDARAALGTADAIVVVPVRDALDIQQRLAACAAPPISVVGVDPVA